MSFSFLWLIFSGLFMYCTSAWKVGDRCQILNTMNEDAFKNGEIIEIQEQKWGPTLTVQMCTIKLDNGKIIKQPAGMLQEENAQEKRRERAKEDAKITGPFTEGDKVKVNKPGSQNNGRIGRFEKYYKDPSDGEIMCIIDFTTPIEGQPGALLISGDGPPQIAIGLQWLERY
mmetsp:Transcript_61670/g.75617  ORF Transcript_61670/g.75617 Transcript_61670/m.75617 type:complete len:172 (+) Transcript_61670:48-563(+)